MIGLAFKILVTLGIYAAILFFGMAVLINFELDFVPLWVIIFIGVCGVIFLTSFIGIIILSTLSIWGI